MKLLIDTPNLLFRVAAVMHGHDDDPELKAGLALHSALNTCLKYYRKFKPDEVAMVFENRNNWRKAYTNEHQHLLMPYKGNRVVDATKAAFFTLINEFQQLIAAHTSLLCLTKEGLEGDDMVSAYVHRHAPNDEVIVLSGDRDFIQLYSYPNVRVVDPATDKDRERVDADWFIFEKCIRGDTGDNVMSAFPRVRTTRIEKAFKDEYEREKLMKEEWTIKEIDETTGQERVKVMVVGELFEHNKTLMDLNAQPAHIKQLMDLALDEAYASRSKFSYFHFMQFCGKHELKAIGDAAHNFAAMFSLNPELLKEKEKKTLGPRAKIEKTATVDAGEFLTKTARKSPTINRTNDSLLDY